MQNYAQYSTTRATMRRSVSAHRHRRTTSVARETRGEVQSLTSRNCSFSKTPPSLRIQAIYFLPLCKKKIFPTPSCMPRIIRRKYPGNKTYEIKESCSVSPSHPPGKNLLDCLMESIAALIFSLQLASFHHRPDEVKSKGCNRVFWHSKWFFSCQRRARRIADLICLPIGFPTFVFGRINFCLIP